MKKRLSLVLAMALVLSMVLPSIAMAADWKVISNELQATFNVAESDETTVNTLDELTEAIKNPSINIINIANNSVFTSEKTIKVDRAVTINGNGSTLSFSGLANGEDGLLITAGATVENLTVDAGLEDEDEWVGTYAIQVYDVKEQVTLNNVTATGGNGGILVNGSDVKLEGNINVSDNGYGGIEVSQGKNVGLPALTVSEGATLTNDSEAVGKPTIWEDGVSGCVQFEGEQFYTINVIKDVSNQVHYYLDVEHTKYIELTWKIDDEEVGNDETTVEVESPFTVSVKAEKKAKDVVIPNTLFVIEIDGQTDNLTVIAEDGQSIGYDKDGNFWYWGPRNGFEFSEGATTSFTITADPGTYKVNIYAVQLDSNQGAGQ